jgi:hypothetical protein
MDTIFRSYLKAFSWTAILLLSALFLLAAKSLFWDHIFLYQKLYSYQLQKVATSHDAKTIFVGDSSLGNAIDAGLFSQLSSSKTLNLALTGVYGYGGVYNMIKKAVKTNPVENVVIMLQPRALTAPASYDGYVYTFEGPHDLTLKEWLRVGAAFLNVTLSPYALVNIAKHYLGILDIGEIKNDYVTQAAQIDLGQEWRPIASSVQVEHGRFLQKIKTFCDGHGINLVYVHGPLIKESVDISAPAIAGINRFLEQQGIQLQPRVMAIAREDVGDSDDHVAPAAKQDYTRLYYGLLKDLLIHR